MMIEQRDEFLAAMRMVANSVTIVTTDGPAGKNGATVSSFCSVSADPPTLLVCINKDASTALTVQENGCFCINILSEEMQAAARQFATQGADKSELLSADEWLTAEGRLPSLPDATAFECEILETAEATSHFVFIGKVTWVKAGKKKPLVYLNQKFCKAELL